MKMRTSNFFSIRIAMRCSPEIQSDQYNRLTGSILVGRFEKIDLSSSYI